MVVQTVDFKHIALIGDSLQMKYVVEALRTVSKEQFEQITKTVEESGVGKGKILDAIAACQSFINVVGHFTDMLCKVEENQGAGEAAPTTHHTKPYLIQ